MAETGQLTTHNLQARIKAAIRPWYRDAAKPPFNVEQLVLMAYVFLKGDFNQQDIFTWISNNFRYYGNLASIVCAAHLKGNFGGKLKQHAEAKTLLGNIESVLTSVEIPFTKKYKIGRLQLLPFLEGVAVRGAPDATSNSSSKESRLGFFDLPAELRNVIYELSFGYDHTLLVRSRGKSLKRMSLIRDLEDPSKILEGEIPFANTRPISQILLPLGTCRQFYKEAMPTFWRTNRFCFLTLGELKTFLHQVPEPQRRHIANVSAVFRLTDTSNSWDAFKLLAGIGNLRFLKLHVDEARWLQKLADADVNIMTEETKDKAIVKLPGLRMLCSIRGLENVEFYGPCERIKALVESDMLQPRDDSPGAEKTGKRKAHDDEAESSKDGKAKKIKAA